MTLEIACAAAQRRAEISKATMVVYRILGRSDDEFHVTPNRSDLPHGWIVVAYIEADGTCHDLQEKYRPIVNAIIDGTPIDWPAVQAMATTDHERLLVKNLRTLPNIGGFTNP